MATSHDSCEIAATAATGPRGCGPSEPVGRPRLPVARAGPSATTLDPTRRATVSLASPLEIPSSRASRARVIPGSAWTARSTPIAVEDRAEASRSDAVEGSMAFTLPQSILAPALAGSPQRGRPPRPRRRTSAAAAVAASDACSYCGRRSQIVSSAHLVVVRSERERGLRFRRSLIRESGRRAMRVLLMGGSAGHRAATETPQCVRGHASIFGGPMPASPERDHFGARQASLEVADDRAKETRCEKAWAQRT